MKKYTKIIQSRISDIMSDIKIQVLDKHGLENLHVTGISFSTSGGCPVGYKQVCQYLGRDPKTGKPIIVCNCVPDDSGL
jgi:hypothetical protein